MINQNRLALLRDRLISEARERLASPPSFIEFTGDKDADALINDIHGHPHAFVIAAIMDRQIKAEKAWRIPYELRQRIGSFAFPVLAGLRLKKIERAMTRPESLHRYPKAMAKWMYAAIRRIEDIYDGDASAIWTGNPSSAAIVYRFLEFDGVGQKIATMAANILVRDFRVAVSDRCAIDISVDVQIRRVFARMGFVPKGANRMHIIYRARELNPEYPGIFDLVLWELGRSICRPKRPACGECPWGELCAYPNGEM